MEESSNKARYSTEADLNESGKYQVTMNYYFGGVEFVATSKIIEVKVKGMENLCSNFTFIFVFRTMSIITSCHSVFQFGLT